MPVPLLAVLLAASMQQMPQSPDSIIGLAKETLRPFTDTASLHKGGYFAIGFGGSAKDLSPFQGQHWLAVRQFLTNQPMNMTKPSIIMYLPVHDSLIPIGVAHTLRVAMNTAAPTEIGGVPVEWHTHIVCRGIPGEGQVIANGVQDCLKRGGDPGPNQITMVHAWTVPNPDGPFAHDNPALPFIATGLKAPSHFMRDERLFAIALGESYGARLMHAALIERYAMTQGRQTKLEVYRATMRGIVADLLAAERKGDTKQYDAAKRRALDTWAQILEEYHTVAPTPELRKDFDAELEEMLGSAHHHGD